MRVSAGVDRETRAAVNVAFEKQDQEAIYGYHTDIANSVISTCNPSLPPETLNDSIYTTNPAYSYVNATVGAEVETAAKESNEVEIKRETRRPKSQ